MRDTAKSMKQKRCGIIRLNVQNFLYISEKSLIKRENSKKPIIIRFWGKIHVFYILLTLKVNFHEYKENSEHLNVKFCIFFV